MEKKEGLLDVVTREPEFSHYLLLIALLLSFLLNIIIFLLIGLNNHPGRRTLVYHAKPSPTIFVDDLPQLMPAHQIQQPLPTPKALPAIPPALPTPVQQKKDEQRDMKAAEEERKKALDYLVKQLISAGNSEQGKVSLSVGTGSENESDITPDKLPIEQPHNERQDALSEPALTLDEKSPPKEKKVAVISPAMQAMHEQASRTVRPEPGQGLIKQVPYPVRPELGQGSQERVRNKPHEQAQKAQPQSKRQLTLADITAGFIKQVHNERSMSYHYDPNKKKGGGAPGVHSPSSAAANSREFALQMYASKVFTLMQQAAYTLTSMIYAQNDFEAITALEITIDERGKLLACQLNPAIGEKDIEDAVQTIVRRVGLFPAIPKHFGTDTITLTFPLSIRGAKGFGKYSLSYAFGGH